MNPPVPPTGAAPAPDKAPAPAPLLQPEQMEGMFAGLDKMASALPMERRQQMEQLLATSSDPDTEKAGWANVAFLADRYGKSPDEIAQNTEAYRNDYAHQMFHVEKDVDDKEFYGLVGQHFQQQRDERGLLGEAQGKLFEAFRQGSDDWRKPFTQSLAEMAGKPGYDPKRLDVYRSLAEKQWGAWQQAGQHYPAVVDALGTYFKQERGGGTAPGQEEQAMQVRQAALHALQTVPDHDQDAVLGLAMRGLPEKKDTSLLEKGANRMESGVGDFAVEAGRGLYDLATGVGPGGPAIMLGNQYMRRTERKLDQVLSGQVDPNTSNNWLASGVLSAAEGLPRMMAMFTPPGVVLNLAAFSEESRGHFEDAGVAPEKAAILGPLAGLGLTALQTVNSQVLMGRAATAGMERWMGQNLAGKAASALVKGYAKNIMAAGTVDTATLGTITAGQQLTEPAIQAVAAQLDKSIPGIQWSGKDGELAKLARATPETLASLVPLIVLGTGMGTLRSREFARNTVKNETALRAMGFPDEAVQAVMALKDPQAATLELQKAWLGRKANPAAVEAMNEKAAKPDPTKRASVNADGTYTVSDATGPVDQAGSAEMAAKAMKDDGIPDLAGEGLGGQQQMEMHFGITNPAMARAMEWVRGVATGAKNVWQELRSIPEFTKFKEIINKFNGEQQRRGMVLATEVRQVFEAVPDRLTRRAMYRAIEAGFDKKQLEQWRDGSTRLSAKQAYEAALNLTPEQIAYAKQIKAWFESKHPQAVNAGLLDPAQKRKNYVPLMVDKPYEVKGLPRTYGGRLKGEFSHAITREFENTFAVENATDDQGNNLGLKLKSDDPAEIMAAYGSELDKVELTREALKELASSKAKAKDGEPLVAPVHGVLTSDVDKNSTISNPSSTVTEAGVKYETLDHPAFKRFYFAGNDLEGKPVMFKGEMGLHPEIYQHLANVLEKSRFQNWMDSPGGAVAYLAKLAPRALQEAQRFIKANMFSASAFHATHIGTRAAGNIVAPWELRRVTPDDPVAQKAMRLGLQLGMDNEAMKEVEEGLGGGRGYNLLAHVKGVEKVVNGITKLTFHEIIPAYKLATWEKLNARNLEIFAKEIKAGTVTADQVGYLTSHQVNARFGEQNYADLGANPTFRHILSLTTLAPDFWRSNMQNLGQVAVGLTGAKAGREPMKAFVITAGVTWLMARVLNKALSDDDSYHFDDPFAVHHGGRTYSFRTEVQDVAQMATKPAQYLMGRLAPFASSVLEYLAGVNWRGEKVNAVDVLKETATKAIPAALKWVPAINQADEWGTGHRSTTSHTEQFLTSQGIKVGRDSPLNAAYQLANDYKKDVLKKDDKEGAYPVSKFQQLRYALEDGDTAKAKKELAALVTGEETMAKVSKGLHSAIFHPWTGSHKTDHQFKASLSPEDLAKVEKAEAHRRDIWAAFHALSGDNNEPEENP